MVRHRGCFLAVGGHDHALILFSFISVTIYTMYFLVSIHLDRPTFFQHPKVREYDLWDTKSKTRLPESDNKRMTR